MGMLTREKLLNKQHLRIEKVQLDEENYVYVREMVGRERDQFEASLLKSVRLTDGSTSLEQDLADFRAKLAVFTMCDEKGTWILTPSDYQKLSVSMKASWLTKIATVAQELNAISEEAERVARKNSGSSLTEGSRSGSA